MTARLLTLACLLAVTPNLRAADSPDAETKAFLAPENWAGLDGYWKVSGTMITGSANPGLKFNTFLCSKAKYSDFELSFKVRLKDGVGNSGVQVRSAIVEKEKDKFVVAGPQCDMGQQYWGSLYGEKFGKDGKRPGAAHMMKACPTDFVKKYVKEKEFNDYALKIKGKHVTITVNGQTTVDADFDYLPADGIIAFQLHAGPPMEAVFQEIKFKTLK